MKKIQDAPHSMCEASKRTDISGLEALALTQGGYFDRADAVGHGITDDLLHHHTQRGRFERVYRGVYRMHNAPLARQDAYLRAWIWSNYRGVISHESALELYGLSDVLPSRVHLTVPPRFIRTAPGYRVHRSMLAPEEVIEYEGLLVTTPARTIVDAAAAGTGPEQIEMAIRQAIERGLTTAEQLRAAAARPGYRHRRMVIPMIEGFLRHAEI